MYQAILPLRGKVLNVEKVKLDLRRVLKNQELATLVTALGTGIGTDFDIGKLRYHTIVLMTDADVDGSHIRTLLLTFFYRMLKEIVERGHLYIAQPPLYRIKKGKKVRYLKKDKDFEEALLDSGLSGLTIECCGRTLEGAELRRLVSAGRRHARVFQIVAQVLHRRIVDKLSRHANLTYQDLLEMPPEQLEAKVRAALEEGPDPIASLEVQTKPDEEFGGHVVICSFVDSGTHFEQAISFEVLSQWEYRELLELRRQMDAFPGPYKVISDKEVVELAGLDELVELVDQRGRRGVTIQRYKGLGEMNPEQLWETTMNPETRTMLKVSVEDAAEADALFEALMGEDVESRREFIQSNALSVRNLDV